MEREYAHQMPEMILYHQLQRLRSTARVASDHWVARHDPADRGSMRVHAFGGDL